MSGQTDTCLITLADLNSANFALNTDDIHLWQTILIDQLVDRMESLLSQDECARADRFRFQKDRNHFIVARGLLRTILASYLQAKPQDLLFSHGAKGKPMLKHPGESEIRFNLAHSHGLAIYAICRKRELGVDLELIRNDLMAESIAECFFSQNEVLALRSLPPETQKESFFNCWTRKEAYIKARGEGLSMPLNEFDVSLMPHEPAVLLKNYKDPAEISRWSMQAVPTKPGYAAALVAEGHDWTVKHFLLQ